MASNEDRKLNFLAEILPEDFASQAHCAIISENGYELSYSKLCLVIKLLVEVMRKAGIKSHHRVSTIYENGTSCSLIMIAAMDAAIACPLSPKCTQAEYRSMLSSLESDVLICGISQLRDFQDICLDLSIKLMAIDFDVSSQDIEISHQVIGNKQSSSLKPNCLSSYSEDKPALILLTSGSTGNPKRVGLSATNLLYSAREVATSLGLGSNDVCLSMWEQYHIGGVVDVLLAPLLSGSSILMTTGFSLENLRRGFNNTDVTWLQCVPTTLIEMIRCVKNERISLPASLRFIRSVASQLPISLHIEAESVIGVPVLQTYGMTEASPLITSNRLNIGAKKIGTVGQQLSTEIKIVSSRELDGQLLVIEEEAVGEILIRGANVIKQYDDPTGETELCFKDGWFRTGDTGYFDEDGFLVLTGRVKKMINRGGEKIAPLEIESAAIGHCGVEGALAFPIPHKTLGSVVGLVVCGDGIDKSSDMSALREFLACKLSTYKLPAGIWGIDRIPSTTTGKLLQSKVDEIIQDLPISEMAVRLSNDIVSTEIDSDSDVLHQYLKNLWKTEIDVPSVGIDDDFQVLGGDSLSSIRLLAQIEVDFGIQINLSSISGLTTVRKLAVYLRSCISLKDASVLIAPLAKRKSSCELGLDYELEGLERKIVASQTVFELRRNKELCLNRLTLQEILGLIERINHHFPYENNGTAVDLRNELLKWKQESLTESSIFPNSLNWVRQQLSPNAQLYQCNSKGKRAGSLIVGVTGNQMRLMLPINTIISRINGSMYDLLLIQDPSRSHYAQGVDGIASSLDSLAQWLKYYASSSGYQDVTAFGTSAGALAAILIGLMNSWKRSIGIGAEKPTAHLLLREHISALRGNASAHLQASCTLLYDPLNQRDREGALEIKEYLASVKLLTVNAGGEHNFLHVLRQSGKLKSLLDNLFTTN